MRISTYILITTFLLGPLACREAKEAGSARQSSRLAAPSAATPRDGGPGEGSVTCADCYLKVAESPAQLTFSIPGYAGWRVTRVIAGGACSETKAFLDIPVPDGPPKSYPVDIPNASNCCYARIEIEKDKETFRTCDFKTSFWVENPVCEVEFAEKLCGASP